jgi:hypothetical protein
MMIQVSWDVTTSRLLNSYGLFGGVKCLHLSGQAVKKAQEGKKAKKTA